ncbi:MAG: hypothetical protein AAB822_00900 [Patescibacteria group bacterium]
MGIMNTALEKLFGSSARIKMIRLFLSNPEVLFSSEDVSRRAKVPMDLAKREISLLRGVDLIKQKDQTIDETVKLKGGETKIKKKKITVYFLNTLFPFVHALRSLVLNAAPVNKEAMIKEINTIGRIKLIVFSGIFTNHENSRVDLLLVGDSMKETKLDKVLKNIEAEIGKEIVYAVFKTEDFMYRMGMYDRFIRDILEYPHEKAVNKLNI